MALDEISPTAIAQFGRHTGGVDDVGEQDGRQDPVELSLLRPDRIREPHHWPDDIGGVAQEGLLVLALRRFDACPRDLRAQVFHLLGGGAREARPAE